MNKIFFEKSSKNYYAASLFSLHLVCIIHNKFKYKCCCNNSLNLTPDFLLCLMHVESRKGGFGQETQWASSSHTEIQHNMMFWKYYLKRQWPGEKILKPKNNLKLVIPSSYIKDIKKKSSAQTLYVWSISVQQIWMTLGATFCRDRDRKSCWFVAKAALVYASKWQWRLSYLHLVK